MSENQPYEVVMPKLGLIMTEANLYEWHKGDGEWVEKGEPLFSFESDKSAIEIESPASGYVQILVPVGETVAVNVPVARIHPEQLEILSFGGAPTSPSEPEAPVSSMPEPSSIMSVVHGAVRATPKARRVALSRGVDLSTITGSGPRGMIVTADLEEVPSLTPISATPLARKMAAEMGIDLRKISGTGPAGRITREDVTKAIATLVRGKPVTAAPKPAAPIPLEGLRGLIAERLSASWQERPQVTLHMEVDATRLLEMRQNQLTPAGEKISLNTFFVVAAARAMAEFPEVNVQLTEQGLVRFEEINIGIAVDTARGLVVPVLRDAGGKTLLELDSALNDLVERTLGGKALPEEFMGGTFTVTNLGAFGVDLFTPIINPPEAAILGIGRIQPKPVAVDRLIAVRDRVTLSLSFDHRVIDGAPSARFLHRIGEFVENPDSLL